MATNFSFQIKRKTDIILEPEFTAMLGANAVYHDNE
jgi:hypothetical protein